MIMFVWIIRGSAMAFWSLVHQRDGYTRIKHWFASLGWWMLVVSWEKTHGNLTNKLILTPSPRQIDLLKKLGPSTFPHLANVFWWVHWVPFCPFCEIELSGIVMPRVFHFQVLNAYLGMLHCNWHVFRSTMIKPFSGNCLRVFVDHKTSSSSW